MNFTDFIKASGGRIMLVAPKKKETTMTCKRCDTETEVPDIEIFELKQEWCPSDDPNQCAMYAYPDDGECACGLYKHHVHCIHGYVIQIG